jgi:hypothetical protein
MNTLLNKLAGEPVAINMLVTALTWLAARYIPGLELSPEQATAIAGAVLLAGTAIARMAVTTLRQPRTADGKPAQLIPKTTAKN